MEFTGSYYPNNPERGGKPDHAPVVRKRHVMGNTSHQAVCRCGWRSPLMKTEAGAARRGQAHTREKHT